MRCLVCEWVGDGSDAVVVGEVAYCPADECCGRVADDPTEAVAAMLAEAVAGVSAVRDRLLVDVTRRLFWHGFDDAAYRGPSDHWVVEYSDADRRTKCKRLRLYRDRAGRLGVWQELDRYYLDPDPFTESVPETVWEREERLKDASVFRSPRPHEMLQ